MSEPQNRPVPASYASPFKAVPNSFGKLIWEAKLMDSSIAWKPPRICILNNFNCPEHNTNVPMDRLWIAYASPFKAVPDPFGKLIWEAKLMESGIARKPPRTYCGMPGSPCLSKTGLMLARILNFLSGLSICVLLLLSTYPLFRRDSRWGYLFFGDPASLARNNIY